MRLDGKAAVITKFGIAPITNRRFPVDSNIVSRHTANAVLKQAGIAKQF